MTTTLYGIPNCDTVKKARAFLAQHQVAHVFHDYKKQGVPAEPLDRWIAALGWERVLNRKGNTWRRLDAQAQAVVVDAASARALMLAQPSVIKRPLLDHDGRLSVGFDEADWANRFA